MNKKLIAFLYILATQTLTAVMSWAINQLPGQSALGIPPQIIILITVVALLASVFLSTQSSGSQTSLATTNLIWVFSLPAIGSIILYLLLKTGNLPSELAQPAAYVSLLLFLIGTLLPAIIIAYGEIQHSHIAQSTATETNVVTPPVDIELSPISSTRYRLAVILNAETFSQVYEANVQSIITHLRNLSGDSSLRIVGIEKGSIIITLEASQKGIEKIESLHQSGSISEILGIRVKDLLRVDLNNKTLQEEAGINVEFYIKSQIQIEKILQEKLNIAPEEKLFGIEENLAILRQYLQDKEGSWFISIAGEGGIGKTSIAEKLVRKYTAISGFEKLAWITAKRTYLNPTGETQNTRETLNIDSMIYEIARQLGITLPPTLNEQFPYLQEKLQSSPYLILIDSLETFEEYQTLFSKFDIHSSRNNFKPSKVIFTSRVKIQKTDIRELRIKGLSEKASLELIRYQGNDLERIKNASDGQLLPIYSKTEGNPLLIKLVVSLIKRYDSPLNEIIDFIKMEDQLLNYLYVEALHSISDNARIVINAMTSYVQSSAVSYQMLKDTTGLEDTKLREAIQECVRHSSLLSSLPHQLDEEPRYSIHNLLYEYLTIRGSNLNGSST
ncbi:NB-ARC domain-containing protein [Microcoleus sp. S13_B4]|uniref:NB-ARC domain-containing protein n=1 Tax=Microcoleus sp. S13_B4 TaxID=3055408 RepID=UPI002FCF68D3